MQKKEMIQIKKEVRKELKKELDSQKEELDSQKEEIKEQRNAVGALIREEKKLRLKLKSHAGAYMSEMKKALSTAIIAAFAFLMALSWREYISDWLESVLFYSPLQGKLINALVITLISVIGILIVTKTLSAKES